MLEGITAWCERLRAQRQELRAVASDIEYLCRAHSEARHDNFWAFGMPRLLELLAEQFREEESHLHESLDRQDLEAHRFEHRKILVALQWFKDRSDAGRVTAEHVGDAERDVLYYLDEQVAEHFFSMDDEALSRIAVEKFLQAKD